MNWRWTNLLTAISGALLAACAGGLITSGYTYYSTHYDRSTLAYAIKGGSMPLVVHGKPFQLSKQASDGGIAAAMSLPGWITPVPFEMAPVPTAPSGKYRTVLAFNADRAPGSRFLCREAASNTRFLPKNGQVRVHAAFCADDYLVSGTYVVGPADALGTPEFQRLLDRISIDLFPQENPETLDDRNDDFRLR